MGVTTKPANLPSSNALDRFQLDSPAEIRLAGKILTILDNAPGLGERVTLMVTVEVTEICEGIKKNGDPTHYRKSSLIRAWKPGDNPPADTNQGNLFAADAEPQAVGDVINEMTNTSDDE